MMTNPLRVMGNDGVFYYAFCDANNDLVCLVCTEYTVPFTSVLDLVNDALDNDDQLYANKSEWNIAEWNTWLAFELCPVIEIISVGANNGMSTDMVNEESHSWMWRRIKP
jgi:hypothetical protein